MVALASAQFSPTAPPLPPFLFTMAEAAKSTGHHTTQQRVTTDTLRNRGDRTADRVRNARGEERRGEQRSEQEVSIAASLMRSALNCVVAVVVVVRLVRAGIVAASSSAAPLLPSPLLLRCAALRCIAAAAAAFSFSLVQDAEAFLATSSAPPWVCPLGA